MRTQIINANIILQDGILYDGVPARVMGYTDRGMIRVGKRADLLLMDQELQINKIIFGGEIK